MKSIFGDQIQVCLFGESHSPAVGAVLNGLAPGIRLDLDLIRRQMEKRRAKGRISTARREADELHILSGFFNGYTTGTPLCLLIENQQARSGDYESARYLPRPSHADYTAFERYGGFQDYRGGGHFSGRLTAPIVAAGGIALQILNAHGIRLGTHILRLGAWEDTAFSSREEELAGQLAKLDGEGFPALDGDAAESMARAVEKAAAEGDSLGGVLETAVLSLPAGIGEPFFCSVESKLSQLMFSIPGVKGVEFGLGFGFAGLRGSQANDPFRISGGRVVTQTNHNGGLNGGITNGMPVLFRTAVKPTPSIYQEQDTVDLEKRENARLRIQGRHDPAIIHRARVVVDSMAALGLLDLLIERFGPRWMTEGGQ